MLIHCSTIAQAAKPFTVGVIGYTQTKHIMSFLRVEEVHLLKARAYRPRTGEMSEVRTLMELLACFEGGSLFLDRLTSTSSALDIDQFAL